MTLKSALREASPVSLRRQNCSPFPFQDPEVMFKVLPSKSIPVINAGHEEFTSKNGGPDVLSLGCTVSGLRS